MTTAADIAAFLGFQVPTTAPRVEIGERVEQEGLVRVSLSYDGPDGDRVAAFMLVPTSPGPHAGVLALHQHNSEWTVGKSEVCGLTGDRWQAFAPAFAQRGVCVLAPDAIGFESRCGHGGGGGRNLAPHPMAGGSGADGWLQFYNEMCYRLVRGDHLMRSVLRDASCALSVLAGHEKVDASRLGAVGHSLGGNTILFLAALDPRLRFSCASGAACTYRHKMRQGTGLEMSLVIPGCTAVFDIDDLVRCVAPRSILLVSSEADPMTADAHDIVDSARPVFETFACPEHLVHVHRGNGHALDEGRFDAIVEWMHTEAMRSATKDINS